MSCFVRISLSMKTGSAEAQKAGSPEVKQQKTVTERDMVKKLSSRYAGNPFYEAFKKKRDGTD
jgi:hypothetical protein